MDIKTLPPLVAHIYMARTMGTPISLEMYNKALDEYPEYFKDEVARRDKMNAVPDEVHKKYLDELYKLYESFNCVGLMNLISNKNNAIEKFKQRNKEIERKKQEIWDKHYKKYGIEYGN